MATATIAGATASRKLQPKTNRQSLSKVNTQHRQPRGPTVPIGTVRTWSMRNAGGMVIARVNYTKTPSGWMRTASWNWLQHHGYIPDGYRVIHTDATDTLNDDLSNLSLSLVGDLTERIQQSKGLSASLRRKKRLRNIAKANRQRARINAAIEIRPGYWYPIIREPYTSSSDGISDKERGTIFMSPTRTRTINGWARFPCGVLSIVRGIDLMTLDEYRGMRREMLEERDEDRDC